MEYVSNYLDLLETFIDFFQQSPDTFPISNLSCLNINILILISQKKYFCKLLFRTAAVWMIIIIILVEHLLNIYKTLIIIQQRVFIIFPPIRFTDSLCNPSGDIITGTQINYPRLELILQEAGCNSIQELATFPWVHAVPSSSVCDS